MKNLPCMVGLLMILIFSAYSASQPVDKSIPSRRSIKSAIDKGIRFLRHAQNKNGHWDNPGITAIAVTAFLKSPRKYGLQDGPWVRKPIEYLVNCQKADGGIYVDQLANYNTCVAIMALTANKQIADKYRHVIEKAKKFILQLQCDEQEGYTPKQDKFYGGIGYGGDERPDLSNTQYAIEALRAAGLSADDPALKKAILFLQRCQNRSESNDQTWAGSDGGFVYYPGNSAAGTQTLADGRSGYRSYGSMTYAGIKSYVYANLTMKDPRVKAAFEWIRRNYDLSRNPGAGRQGLFYYYHTFAKTLALLKIDRLHDAHGAAHNWRADLATALQERQKADGSWENENSRWWEADPRLVTAYSLLALSLCMEE